MGQAPLGLMGALEEELGPVLAELQQAQAVQVAGRTFWQGQWHGQPLVAVLTGIGKVAAATTATVLIERLGVQRLVFTGVAGGLGPDVRVGDVVVARQLLQHDMDASPLFPRFQVPGYGRSHFAADPELTQGLAQAALAVLAQVQRHVGPDAVAAFGLQAPQVHQGLVLSGDRFVATAAESRALQAALPQALAVEMEGAALAQVCADYGVPFAAVRTISDRADDVAHTDFARFIRQVAGRYSHALLSTWLQSHALT